jgi:hypothetical protein
MVLAQVNGGQLPHHVMPFCIAFGILAAVLPCIEALAKYKHQHYQQQQQYVPLQDNEDDDCHQQQQPQPEQSDELTLDVITTSSTDG